MTSNASSAIAAPRPMWLSRRVSLTQLAHFFPLLFILGGTYIPVIGKQFYLPFYLPLLYILLLRASFATSLRRVPRQDFWVGLYCAAGLASLSYAQDLPKYAYGAFSLFMIGIPAYALGRQLGARPTWSPRLFLGVLIALSGMLSLLYLARLATDPLGFRTAYLYKFAAVGGMRSNTLVSLHVFGFVATIMALPRMRGLSRGLLVAVLALQVAGGLAFNSRAYTILMCIPLAAYLITGRDRVCWTLRGVLALTALALVARPPQALVETVTHRWATHLQRGGSWLDSPRAQIWSRSLEVWREQPLFGHGLSNSFLGPDFLWGLVYTRATLEEISRIPQEALAYRPDGWFMAHNTILQLLIEVGLFGAIVFIVILARFVSSLLRLLRCRDPDAAALAKALLVGSILAFVDGLIEPSFLTRDFGAFAWFLIGLVYSAEHAQHRRPATPSARSSGGAASEASGRVSMP